MTTAQQATRALERRGVDLFDAESFGPGLGDRKLSDLRRIWRWSLRLPWPARVVLWLMALAVCYIALVAGMLVGAGIAPWFAFDRHVSVIYRPLAPPVGTSPMRPAGEHDRGRLDTGRLA
jgi:hypothetical protein